MRLLAKRRLRCSFCGKPDSEVGKLIAGSKAYICDVCIDSCNRILDAMPRTFAGWEAMSAEQLLAALKPAAATVEATRSVLQAQVDDLRRRGISWELIGRALGTSRQAAWERFSQAAHRCQAAGLAVSSIPSAFITASVVLSVGLPFSLNER